MSPEKHRMSAGQWDWHFCDSSDKQLFPLTQLPSVCLCLGLVSCTVPTKQCCLPLSSVGMQVVAPAENRNCLSNQYKHVTRNILLILCAKVLHYMISSLLEVEMSSSLVVWPTLRYHILISSLELKGLHLSLSYYCGMSSYVAVSCTSLLSDLCLYLGKLVDISA